MLLEIKNLEKQYGNKTALNNITLDIEKGKIIGLLGPNGSGKTTLIKIINNLLVQTSGSILINGNKPGIETKKVVAYLPENTYLDNNMRVSEVIKYFSDFYDDFNPQKASDLLLDLNINEDDKLNTMSKGMKEKVQLVLVLSRDADLYILDEPLGGVDSASRDYILDTIIKNYNKDASMIISTHLISDIERILDDVIFISNGNIILHDSAENVVEHYGTSIDNAFKEVFIHERISY